MGSKSKTTKQTQKSGSNSTNLQAETVVVNNGMTYSDVKEIILDTFSENFLVLSQQASQVASKRAEEMTNSFLEKLKSQNLDSIEGVKDPGFQYALFESQKHYAKSGDKDVADVLVDILVDRVKHQERDLKQIVLEESINVVPKLTSAQLDVLTLIFVLRYSINNGLKNSEDFINYLKTYIEPFTHNLSKENSLFQHLEFAGCGNVQITSMSLEKPFKQNYSAFFCAGFTKEDFEKQIGEFNKYRGIIIACFNDKDLLQLGVMNEDALEFISNKNGYDKETTKKLKKLFVQNIFPDTKIKDKIIENTNEFMKTLFDVWENSSMKSMTLTTVGISIAQANFRRKTKISLDLSNWIK